MTTKSNKWSPALYLHQGRADKPRQRSLCQGPTDTHQSVCASGLRSWLRSNRKSWPTPKVWDSVMHFWEVNWYWWRELHTGIFGGITLQHEFKLFKLSKVHANPSISFSHGQTAWSSNGTILEGVPKQFWEILKSSEKLIMGYVGQHNVNICKMNLKFYASDGCG